MKKLFATLLALALLASCCAALAEAPKFEGAGYDSPEAAVEAYIEAFNAGDVWGMLSTFAIETAVDHMDQKAAIQRIGAWQSTIREGAPVFNGYSRDLAVAQRVGAITNALNSSMLTYAWPEDFNTFDGMPVHFNGDDADARIDAFLGGFAASDFAGWIGQVALERFVTAEDLGVGEAYFNESSQTNLARFAKACGCDELEERAAILNAAGRQYVQFMQCVRYGDRWYNYSQMPMLAHVCSIDVTTGGLVALPDSDAR